MRPDAFAPAKPNGARRLSDLPTLSLGGLPIALVDRKQSARSMVDIALARRGDQGLSERSGA